ncbi:MAG: DUF3693 domain-containing protein [Stenotrophomonas indicatrix]|uniref:DUF3693 domain-containing protein n=1 Tax=Stenotrophomonas indicatrix TaxID=2045451 RepID=UPI003D10D217
MDVNSLLDQAKEACGASYDKDLAPRLGVRPSAISNYRKGVSHPDAVVCATLAGLTGVPLARVLGVIGEARAISREEKAVWRKLAATAMALCLAVGFALPHKAQAAATGFESAHAVYIMRNAISAVVGFVSSSWHSSAPLGNGYRSGSALASQFVD